MKLITTKFETDKAYILPIGDLHWGDRAFKKVGLPKLKEYLNWANDRYDHAGVVLLGDIFNVAGVNTKTSPFESDPAEYGEFKEFIRPYAPIIKCAVPGNHEWRMVREFGLDPLKSVCDELRIPYLGVSGILRVQVGRREGENAYWQTYHLAVHHSRGGGGKLGNSTNRAIQLADIYEGCDAHLIGHNHNLTAGTRSIYYPGVNEIKERKVYFVSCGSFLSYPDSYAEVGMMTPSKLGSPRIRLDGRRDRHDLHCSI